MQKWFLLVLHCLQELASSIAVCASPHLEKELRYWNIIVVQNAEMINGTRFLMYHDWQDSPVARAEEKVA